MNASSIFTARVSLCLFAILGLTACSKDSKPADLFNVEVVGLLPNNTPAFCSFDFESNVYANQQKASGSEQELLKNITPDLMKQFSEDSEVNVKLVEASKKAGLITDKGINTETISKIVFAIEPIGKNIEDLALSIYLKGKSEINMTDKLTSLKSLLGSDGFEIENLPNSVHSGFTAALKETSASNKNKLSKFTIFGTKNILLISSAKPEELMGRFETALNESMHNVVKTNPALHGELSKFDLNKGLFACLLDVKTVAANLDKLDKKNDDESPKLSDIPISWGLLVRTAKSERVTEDRARLILSKPAPEINELSSTLSAESSPKLFLALHDNSVLSVGLAGGLLKVAKSHYLREAPAADAEAVKNSLSFVDSIDGLTLALSKAGPNAIFPDLTIRLATTEAETVKKLVMDLVDTSGLGAIAGQPTGWLEKTVGTYKLSYIVSSMGVGAFIGVDKGGILISSGESIFNQLTPENAKLLENEAAFAGDFRDLTKGRAVLGGGRLSYPALADLISSLSSLVGMFTGGDISSTQEIIESFKKGGTSLCGVSITNTDVGLDCVNS